MLADIYIPVAGSYAENAIAPGSGIVGYVDPDFPDTITVYFEGNLYGASNLNTWEARLHQAAGRMQARYPTTAKALLPPTDLVHVGEYDTETGRCMIAPEHRSKVDAWVGRA